MRVREKTATERERERDHQEAKQQGERQWARSPKRREAAAKEPGAPGFEKSDHQVAGAGTVTHGEGLHEDALHSC